MIQQKQEKQLYFPRDRVKLYNQLTQKYTKTGTIEYLRDDAHEKQKREGDKTHYYYSVKYDDGTSDLYLSQTLLAPLK